MKALWESQFNIRDQQDEIARLNKMVSEYDIVDQRKTDEIAKLERELKLFHRIVKETSDENKELSDLIKYIFHSDYIKDSDTRGVELYKRVKQNLSTEQKKLLVDYLDYYKYDYIEKSMNSVKDLTALEYRNWSLWAIASLKLVIQKMIDPKQKFDSIIWEFVKKKVKDAEEDTKK